LRLIGGGASCPTAAADPNAHGIVSLSEGQSAFGTSLLDLTPVPTSTASDAVAFTSEYKVNPAA